VFFEERKRQFLEPARGNGVQLEDVTIRVKELHHAFGTDLLGEEAEADFDLLDVVEFESEAGNKDDVDRIALRDRGIRKRRAIAHFVGVTLGVESFGPDPGHGGICLWRRSIERRKECGGAVKYTVQ